MGKHQALAVAVVLASFGVCCTAPVAEAATPIPLPKDPRQLVLEWNVERTDLPQTKPGPMLTIRADGQVTVTQPHGAGKPVEAKLTVAQLQEVLASVIGDGDFFAVDSRKLQMEVQAACRKAGLAVDGAGRSRTTLRVRTEAKDHQVDCIDLDEHGDTSPEAARLVAIHKRLERLVAWAYLGGDTGLVQAVKLANDHLTRELPDVAPLTADDLLSAVERTNGSSQIIFERRGVAADKNPFSFVQAMIAKDMPQAEARVTVRASLATAEIDKAQTRRPQKGPFKLDPPPVASDKSVNWDYPIVYVRAPRDPEVLPQFANTHPPTVMPPGCDLVILYPDGREEMLVEAGEKEAIVDPYVSFDGQWVYYAKMHDVSEHPKRESRAGSDVFKVHVATRKIVQLTNQRDFTPNTAVAQRAQEMYLKERKVFNLGPCPVPGGKVVFTSDRNAFRAAPAGTHHPLAMQLFVMDDEGANVETIGHMNLGGVQHPVILRDGRIIFTTNETQGLRGGYFFWGVWSMHPDGSNWNPLVSAYDGDVFHFYTQLSDERVVMNNYYPGGLTRGFGTYHMLPVNAPEGLAFGPAYQGDPRNRTGVTINSMSFTPYRFEALTVFATKDDVRPNAAFGKVTHPSGAPENHLLTAWATSATPKDAVKAPDQARPTEPFDSGLYLIKSGKPINQPGEMLLVKNDPKFHELWPRALVPYSRIYGIREPKHLAPVRNDGKLTKHLPEGVPYGLIGTSSLYKRESFPQGIVPEGKVTAEFNKKSGSTLQRDLGGVYTNGRNWLQQGADAGLYSNDEIHAIRIVATEPVTMAGGGDQLPHRGHATNFQDPSPQRAPSERLRILGEFPVRKFLDNKQPIDPDGNPDTSFEVKIPADVAWTFQTLDKRGMVLNMAQTWHQVRAGERRNNCGGCHAHSQKPTDFNLTAAAKDDYEPWDLTGDKRPLLTTRQNDQTGKQWDVNNETGVRYVDRVANVEYLRDIKPILERSCVACHTKNAEEPPAKLVLDADDETVNGVPGTYYRLAMDKKGQYGIRPLTKEWGGYVQVTRYIRKMQSRRSILAWKIFGERLDGFKNEDHPTEKVLGDPETIEVNGERLPNTQRSIERVDIDFTGTMMPPPDAVKEGKVKPLTDEDRRMIVRWIDLGCPIDLDFDPKNPAKRGRGWMLDDNRPTLTLTSPAPGKNTQPLSRIVIGMHDYYTGLDLDSFTVTANFAIDDIAPGENVTSKFKRNPAGVWELPLTRPIAALQNGLIKVSIKDREGNLTIIERTFQVASPAAFVAQGSARKGPPPAYEAD